MQSSGSPWEPQNHVFCITVTDNQFLGKASLTINHHIPCKADQLNFFQESESGCD